MANALLVTHGTDGDVLPFVRLGAALRARGHDVTLLTHAPYAAAARQAGLAFVAVDTAEAYARNLASTPELLQRHGLRTWVRFYERNDLFGQAVRECRALAERYRPGETVLVGRHTSAVSVLFAAEAATAPALWVALSPIQLMAARGAAHLYAGGLRAGLETVRAQLGLAPLADWATWITSARLQVGLWPAWFDRAGTTSRPPVRLAGFPMDTEQPSRIPRRAAALLAGQPPPVLVTGGTGRMLHERFYKVAVEGCRLAGFRAIVVTRHRDLVPEPLPDGLHWFPQLPYQAVLPHAGAVLHHGGIGTLAAALAARTPQVILAHGADRADNAERLARLGLARWLPAGRWEPRLVAELLRASLQDRGYQDRVAVHAPDLDGGLARAADAVEAALRPPGPDHIRERVRRLTPATRAALARRLRAPARQEGSA